MPTVADVQQRVQQRRDEIIRFLRDICAIPSMDSQIGPVGERIQAEMRRLGWDEARFDRMGNTVGRIGDGPKVIVYDSHIDTVGVGDPAEWGWDPFVGKVEDGRLYARGAVDEKGSTPGMVHGLAIARDLGLLDGCTVYYLGNMEEWCDGIAPNAFVEVDPKVRPDFVVIGEPTNLRVYRGHKGRIELKITAAGPLGPRRLALPRRQRRLQDGGDHHRRSASSTTRCARASGTHPIQGIALDRHHRRRGPHRLAQRRARTSSPSTSTAASPRTSRTTRSSPRSAASSPTTCRTRSRSRSWSTTSPRTPASASR